MEKEEKKFRLKHPEIWIAALVLSVTVAAVAFAYSCSNMNKKEPGLYLITPNTDETIKYYANDFTFYEYFDGDSGEISSSIKELTNLYSEQLAYYYASVDDEVIYTTYPSIARLNERPNEVVLLGSTVVDFIKKGYEYTESYSNYSIFASPLYAFWYQQCGLYTTERNARDPINNETSVTYLSTLANYINSKDHINIEFIDDDKAKINVSAEYLKFREDNGITAPLVSLNIIKNQVLMDNIRSYLEEKGYSNGYIISNNGSILEFKNANKQVYNLYTLNLDKKVEVYGTINLSTTNNNMTTFRRFDLGNEDVKSSYVISKDDVNYYRSIYIDISSGLSNNVILNSSVYLSNNNVTLSSLVNNELSKYTSLEEISTYIKSLNISDLNVSINTTNIDKKLYITDKIKENIKLNEELDYNLNII